MIFSDSPQQRAMERMMTAVPNFRPRGSGAMVLRCFEYTAEMCDCRLCLHYDRKRKCTASQCPCIEERIAAGAASRAEVMAETMKDIHNAAFCRRLNQFINESEELHMNFRNEKHRLVFVEAIRKLDKKNNALMSAVYLLTAEHKLWMQIRNYVERNEIKFECFKPKDSTENGYTLLCCAKDLYIYLADRANKNGECWPAIPTIARELKLSQSTVRRALHDLRNAGLLETEQRYRKHGGKSSLLFTLKQD